jgi:hypothetical protein
MMTKLNSLLITAAGLTLSSIAAYGQNHIVANVPFSFRTAAGVQPAGQYVIAPTGYDAVAMTLKNAETGKSSILGLGTPNGVEKQNSPRLVFLCGNESGCALTGVVAADGRGWTYKAPRLKPSETERVAVVYCESKQAE